jgi:hypothetical protein
MYPYNTKGGYRPDEIKPLNVLLVVHAKGLCL